MKTLNTYINEKLVLNKGTFKKREYKYFPKNTDELREILNDIFGRNSGSQKIIDLNDIDTSKITDTINLFRYTTLMRNDITKIDISEWDMSNVINMTGMFYECIRLKSVGNLASWNVSQVRDMRELFCNCYSLESVGDLSLWDVSSVTNMTGMFENCYWLKSIGDIDRWDVSKVTSMMFMFEDCNKLESIGDISDWKISKITSFYAMFRHCKKLNSVGDLNKWDIKNVDSDGLNNMFFNTYIENLPKWYKG